MATDLAWEKFEELGRTKTELICRFSHTDIPYLAHTIHKLGIQITWKKLHLAISFELREPEIWNKYIQIIKVYYIRLGDWLEMHREQDLWSNECEKYDLPQFYEQYKSKTIKRRIF